MKKSHLYEKIHRELNCDPIGPAPESFYQEVWFRIRNRQKQASSVRERGKMQVPFGVVCWKSIPAFSIILLISSLVFTFHQGESDEQSVNPIESYVLDTGETPSNEDLLYQIVFTSDNLESEKNP